METEADICADFYESAFGEYETELPAGNQILQEYTDLSAMAGPKATNIDALAERSGGQSCVLAECKRTYSFGGIGQLLLYDYLFRRDREYVRREFENRDRPWESKTAISGFEAHVTEDGYRYYPKPEVTTIDRRLVIGERPPSAALLVAACDIDVDVYVKSPGWTALTSQHFDRDVEPTTDVEACLPELEGKAELDTAPEELVARKFLGGPHAPPELRSSDRYREVPVGTRIFDDETNRYRADLIVYIPGRRTFYIVEVKSDPDIRNFQTAVGQAVSYAALFRHDWNLPADRVVPIVAMDTAPVLANAYRKDRYGGHNTMVEQAAKATDEAVIWAETYRAV